MEVKKKIILATILTAIPFVGIIYNNFIYHSRGWHTLLIQYHSFFWLTRSLVAPILVLVAVKAWQKIDRSYKLFLYPFIILLCYNFICWIISFASCRWLAPSFDGRNKNLLDTIIYDSTFINFIVCMITLLLIIGWLYYLQNSVSKQKNLELKTSLEEAQFELERIRNDSNVNDESKRSESILVKNGHRMIPVPVVDIMYIRSKGAYINIVTETGSYLLKKPLGEIERNLPLSFLRVHRSSIVNFKFVKELRSLLNGDGCLILKDAKEVRLSRTYRENVIGIIGSF